ncbi:hypothetical protein [Streptomyces sp. NPDC001980]|uniref:hypothetical protein n=1 Tax=Streptomyces sp. NPDC001980 TaxID=3157126 RepID=UPI00332D50A2
MAVHATGLVAEAGGNHVRRLTGRFLPKCQAARSETVEGFAVERVSRRVISVIEARVIRISEHGGIQDQAELPKTAPLYRFHSH